MTKQNIGNVIKTLRKEKGLTQSDLAEQLMLSDKTISKWECNQGLPDISNIHKLSTILDVDLSNLLMGRIENNPQVAGNMKRSSFYFCPSCSNISVSTGKAQITCCGRTLDHLKVNKESQVEQLNISIVDGRYHITSDHAMKKDDYIVFIALVNEAEIDLFKLYPEWNVHLELASYRRGTLYCYSKSTGFVRQPLKTNC